jgi:hypothetical protein
VLDRPISACERETGVSVAERTQSSWAYAQCSALEPALSTKGASRLNDIIELIHLREFKQLPNIWLRVQQTQRHFGSGRTVN